MARLQRSSNIYAAADRFRANCLERDGSLFSDEPLWSHKNVQALHTAFVKNPDLGKRTFFEKFEEQLAKAPPEVKRLAAEILAVYLLFSDSLNASTKRHQVRRVLGFAKAEVDDSHPVMLAFAGGVGGTGQAFNQRKPDELTFLVNFAVAWKQATDAERQSARADGWAFANYLDGIEDNDRRAMRHILIHLLFPDTFERIASSGHKRRIAEAFQELVPKNVVEIDRKLSIIRSALENLVGNNFDFYDSRIRLAWDASHADEDDEFDALDALHHKKQIVLYGPPGTGKTHRAKALASALIRRAAIKSNGATWYFKNESDLAEEIETRTYRLQLHPALSYEEFVVGIHITKTGETVHRLGLLPRIANEVQAKNDATASYFRDLPFVLILDEINRADLSRLLGEVFSLLEDRERDVYLPGVGEDGAPLKLSLPSNLYLIGTMNLIDQSVEQIDFALRRRFLWLECGFRSADIVQVCRERWTKLGGVVQTHSWDRVKEDFERLARAATALNRAIRTSDALGEAFEIGHAYFFDVVAFLNADLAGAKGARENYLWTKKDAKAPIDSLWRLSLRPLLAEYLRGLEEKKRDAELERLGRTFMTRPALSDE